MKNPGSKNFLMDAVRVVLPVGILAGGVMAFAAITGQREAPPQVERRVTVPLVGGVTVETHNGNLDIRVDGVVVPHREIQLSAEVVGRITHKSPVCRAGHYVTAGTLLVEIDPRTYQLEVNRLREEVKQAEAGLHELDVGMANSQTLLTLAEEEGALRKRELQRFVTLLSQNATSENIVDDARRQELAARNNIASLQNQLRTQEATRVRLESARDLAGTRLEQAQLDLEKSSIRAPIDGVIVSESVEENHFVQTGTSLLSIEDTCAAEVRCNLRMEELAWIWQQERESSPNVSTDDLSEDYHLPRTPVTVSYRLGDCEHHWEGTLWRYEGIGLDEATRTVPCRVLVPHPRKVASGMSSKRQEGAPRALIRGMFVKLTVHAHPETHLLRLPERAVQPGNVVWCVRDGLLNIIPLRNVTIQGDKVLVPELSDGLHQGDFVVTTPLPIATHGMAVQLQNRAADAVKEVAATEDGRR
ncbi:MAG TPA: HlyD family efflux transporter periplasmic adaptor subunit [Planctomicrobium sp.]|nr:HlyD family efflux transporter periplasmic adaptor subunit [Planctomicrobium sp.]